MPEPPFRTSSSPPPINFDLAEGDKIDVSAIDARRHASGDQSFHFIGGHRFTGHAGQLRYKQGVVAGDLNGDGRADFHISVQLARRR